MGLDDFIINIEIYHVSFDVDREEANAILATTIKKTVAFPSGVTEEEVKNTVNMCFSKVKKVQRLTYWEEAILLKNYI